MEIVVEDFLAALGAGRAISRRGCRPPAGALLGRTVEGSSAAAAAATTAERPVDFGPVAVKKYAILR